MQAVDVKQLALDLGADLVGIASAKTLNAFPPDPRFPQTPERISPHVKSVIVLVHRIPVGAHNGRAGNRLELQTCQLRPVEHARRFCGTLNVPPDSSRSEV